MESNTEKRNGRTSFDFIGLVHEWDTPRQYRTTMDGERKPYLDKLDRLLTTAHAYDKMRKHTTTERDLVSVIDRYWDAGCDFDEYRRRLEETENPNTQEAVFWMNTWLWRKITDKGIADVLAGKKVRFHGKEIGR